MPLGEPRGLPCPTAAAPHIALMFSMNGPSSMSK